MQFLYCSRWLKKKRIDHYSKLKLLNHHFFSILCLFFRIQSFQAIQALGLCHHELTFAQKDRMSQVFANFLPGISMACTKVACNGELQNHKVTVVSEKIFSIGQ